MTKLLLGISGGIAAYKTPELIRRVKEQGFDVRIVMTTGANSFVTPMTLQAVSANPVHQELFDCDAEAAMSHIELAKWADVILLAPATANLIAKIASGIADDLLTTLILASSAKLLVAPAMNQQMWANQATQDNINRIKARGASILGPAEGEQACGDNGLGRMLEPQALLDSLVSFSSSQKSVRLKGKRIVITAGPTVEAIDPVRFISNHSSGKMGYALAQQACSMGASVTLISGPVCLANPDRVKRVSVVSASEMLSAVKAVVNECDIFIGCAAVADYTPEEFSENKIKKSAQDMQILLKKTEDIVSWVSKQKDRPFVVGFAAESQNLEVFAKNKLINKNLDMICANDISNQDIGFNSNNNQIVIIDNQGNRKKLSAAPKTEIAAKILTEIEKNISLIES